jgi:prepilin-type N-terminal cleavage/methylation domain-containing protein
MGAQNQRGRGRGHVVGSLAARGRWGGFTLIELLVVIGIIAVLAAIVIPVYARAQEKARQATCLSNMHAIVTAIKMYQMDYRDFPPPYDPVTGYGGITSLYLADYLTATKSLRCPDDRSDIKTYVDFFTAADLPPEQEFVGSAVPWSDDYYIKHYSSYNCMPGVDPAVSGTPPLPTRDYQLYNYYGYDGYGLSHLSTVDADADVGRTYPSTSSKFAGLTNRWTPDETIITHCPFHRDFFGGQAAWQDVVLRLGGNAELMRISGDPVVIWINQRPQ